MRRSKADAENTRNDILDAAERVFFEQGFDATTLDRIARAAGVTRGAVYWHFRDKTEVLAAVRERGVLPQEQILRSASENGHDDPIGLLESTGIEVLRTFEADTRRQRLFGIICGNTTNTEASSYLFEINRSMFEMMIRLTTLARDNGSLSPDWTPEDASVLFWTTMSGLLNEWLRLNRGFSLSQTGAHILHAQARMLRAPARG